MLLADAEAQPGEADLLDARHDPAHLAVRQLLIGAQEDDTVYGKDSGSATFVSIDQYGTFNVVTKVGPTQGDDYDRFGCSVAIDGQWAVVGASGGNANGMDSCGEVYVYRRTAQPCLVCGAKIRTEVLVGRNLFWCPRCQPVFRSRAAG